jgi:DNA polymerase sigma
MMLASGAILQFVDRKTGTEIDIGVNKILEVHNSELIRLYATLSSEFRCLASYLKSWNKAMFKNKMARLNSYSLNLMLIAYM